MLSSDKLFGVFESTDGLIPKHVLKQKGEEMMTCSDSHMLVQHSEHVLTPIIQLTLFNYKAVRFIKATLHQFWMLCQQYSNHPKRNKFLCQFQFLQLQSVAINYPNLDDSVW